MKLWWLRLFRYSNGSIIVTYSSDSSVRWNISKGSNRMMRFTINEFKQSPRGHFEPRWWRENTASAEFAYFSVYIHPKKQQSCKKRCQSEWNLKRNFTQMTPAERGKPQTHIRARWDASVSHCLHIPEINQQNRNLHLPERICLSAFIGIMWNCPW